MSFFITLPAHCAACFSPLYLTPSVESFSPWFAVTYYQTMNFFFFFSHLSSPGILPISGFIDSLFWGPLQFEHLGDNVFFQPFLICDLLKIWNGSSYCGTVQLSLLALDLLFIVTSLWPPRSSLHSINTGYKAVVVGIQVLYQFQCPSDNKWDPGCKHNQNHRIQM